MRYLILADIHANYDALAAVLEYVKNEKIDKYIILGDVVDYGVEPNEVIDTLRKLKPQEAVHGDHEKWFTKELDEEYFDPEVLVCSKWTADHLSETSWEYIRSLPKGPRTIDDTFDIVHGSYPDEDAYIWDQEILLTSFENLKNPIGFYGHTHIPVLISQKVDEKIDVHAAREEKNTFQLIEENKYLINPGSVGQPRDSDPRAGFAILDSDKMIITLYRIPYDHKSAARKVEDAGLPEFFSQRLLAGE